MYNYGVPPLKMAACHPLGMKSLTLLEGWPLVGDILDTIIYSLASETMSLQEGWILAGTYWGNTEYLSICTLHFPFNSFYLEKGVPVTYVVTYEHKMSLLSHCIYIGLLHTTYHAPY